MDAEPTGYRFLDAQNESISLQQSSILHSVEFHPSLDDYVYIAQQRSKADAALPSVGKLSLQAFFLINAVGLPIVLLIYAQPLLAIASLLINLFLALIFFPAVFRFDYRRYLRNAYGEDFE